MLRSLILTSVFLTLPAVAFAESVAPKRLAPMQLGQDDKVTLSPGFSPDGKTIYFAQSECSPIWECPQTLKRADWTPQGWSKPVSVPLPQEGRVDYPAVSPDGETLIFSWAAERQDLVGLDMGVNFDLYTLDLTDKDAVPTPIVTGDINRPRAGSLKTLRYMHNETLASLTHSGALYFMTERPDGIGERDIYVARKNPSGDYTTAVPLPAPINSKRRDGSVWVDADETVMLLSYTDRGGEGGSDIFISMQKDGVWGQPENIGSVVNSPFAEFGARLSPDMASIVFTSDRPFEDQAKGLLQVWTAPFDVSEFDK